ncbi:MAG TPA: hypothetical protein VHT72_07495 [Puia sp.]|jgi:hypothetical protein|nr:hypothetical protein [Puia sp.]
MKPKLLFFIGLVLIRGCTLCPAQGQKSEIQIRFEALSQIESCDDDLAVGKAGEVSRYQIIPSLWKQFGNFKVFPLDHPEQVRDISPTNAGDAFGVTYDIQWHRQEKFEAKYHREPTDSEWYYLWNKPKYVLHPTPKMIERAVRFTNLIHYYEK